MDGGAERGRERGRENNSNLWGVEPDQIPVCTIPLESTYTRLLPYICRSFTLRYNLPFLNFRCPRFCCPAGIRISWISRFLVDVDISRFGLFGQLFPRNVWNFLFFPWFPSFFHYLFFIIPSLSYVFMRFILIKSRILAGLEMVDNNVIPLHLGSKCNINLRVHG